MPREFPRWPHPYRIVRTEPRMLALRDDRIRDIALEDLRFDPQNPRLPRSLNGRSEAAVLRWMLEDATILELMGSIGAQGYFPGEPILVVPEQPGQHQPPYVVVEGNRRFAAAMLLRQPEKAALRRGSVGQMTREARHRPDALPALVFDRRNDVLDYLGYRHVTGIKQWGPLAKARYVLQLVDRETPAGEEDAYREVAKKIGSRADYVARLLQGLSVLDYVVDQAFFGIKGVTEDSIDFAVLTTALSYSAIAKFIGVGDARTKPKLDDRNLTELISWICRELPSGRTILGDSRNLRTLAAVISKPDALRALRAGDSLSEAALFTEEPLGLFRKALREARDRLVHAREYVHRVKADRQPLDDIVSIARDLIAILRSRRDEAGTPE